MSIHPTTTTEEIKFVCDSIKELAAHHKEWEKNMFIMEKPMSSTIKMHPILKMKWLSNGF